MLNKVSILYSWLVRTLMCLLPDIPLIMRARGFLYSLLMKDAGTNFQVSASAQINSLRGFSCGENVYLAKNVVLLPSELYIGSDVIVGPGALIVSGNHVFDGYSFRKLPSTVEPIYIGAGAWVGGGSTVLAGSNLPAMSILAAGSVLTKKYDAEKTIYAGVPAKPIGKVKA